MSSRVVCPRCGQDFLVRVELVALNRKAILCPECDALWLHEQDVRPPVAGSYGVTWFDYSTFMEGSGRPSTHQDGEVRILEPLRR